MIAVDYVIDFNLVWHCAKKALDSKSYDDALSIGLLLCQSDPTFEGGTYANFVAKCYFGKGDKISAFYWATAAVQENPTIEEFVADLSALKDDHMLDAVNRWRSTFNDTFGLSKKLRSNARETGELVWPPEP